MREIVHLQEHTMGTVTFSWRESTCTTMRPQEEIMYPELCWWTWSQAPWTQFALAPLAKSFGLTTSCLASRELATTGPKATTQRARSWWTLSWTWCGRRLRAVTACRASS
ncbi:tubulin beta 4A class IVa [Rhinolophus ferrumequinum]|uniref:Tubulin beta 4A class IVa n=1 Tax=Rhinolophus ferrumequinum TaxID=59479 RepID=A0A7J7U3J8_RHIFE|nr:tubulin beta 4A class IVa [Rhinolophus ferrumequinum]